MSVRVATTGNINLNNTTTTIDGVTLINNDIVLVKNQTAGTQNGIYVVSTTGAWNRSPILGTGIDAYGLSVFVAIGKLGGGNTYVCTSNPGIVATNSLVFTLSSSTKPLVF